MSDDEDYMSDAILAQCGDSRPGLAPKNVQKQHVKEVKTKMLNEKSKTKPLKQLEHEQLQEGLSKSLNSENKGFALLSKMGYKPGMSLGKTGSGRKEPVPVELKTCRSGLGMVAYRKRKQEEVAAMRAQMFAKRQKLNSQLQSQYVDQLRTKHLQKETERDLAKSQRVCFDLDMTEGWSTPVEVFFWPKDALKKSVEEDEDETERDKVEEKTPVDVDDVNQEDLTAEEKLEIVTSYLRETFFYCIWCGIKFEDESDLSGNCPGNTAADHNE